MTDGNSVGRWEPPAEAAGRQGGAATLGPEEQLPCGLTALSPGRGSALQAPPAPPGKGSNLLGVLFPEGWQVAWQSHERHKGRPKMCMGGWSLTWGSPKCHGDSLTCLPESSLLSFLYQYLLPFSQRFLSEVH